MDLVYIRKIVNNKIVTNGFKTSDINDDTELLKWLLRFFRYCRNYNGTRRKKKLA